MIGNVELVSFFMKYLLVAGLAASLLSVGRPAAANWAIANAMGAAGCRPSEVQESDWVMHVFDEVGYTRRVHPMLILYMGSSGAAVYNVINSTNRYVVKEIVVVACGAWPLPNPVSSGNHYAPNGALVYSTPSFHWTLIRERAAGGTNPLRIYYLQRK
jgi:hypothetical protein